MTMVPLLNLSNLSGPDRERITRQQLRRALLMQDYGDDPSGEGNIRPAINAILGPERSGLIPLVDTSNNILLTAANQLSTPGLYQDGAMVFHRDQRGLDLAEVVTFAGYWLQMQTIMFLASGMGDAFLHLEVADGELKLREVPAHCILPILSPERPSEAVGIRELRLRNLDTLVEGMGLAWCWDVYDFSDPKAPIFYIERMDERRFTNILPGRPAEGLIGPDYPWRYANGKPFFPYVHYVTRLSGTWWNESITRGLTRAALIQMAFSTNANQSAIDASHSTAIGINVDLPHGPTQGDDGSGAGVLPVSRMQLLPGSLLALSVTNESAPASITQLRPSADLAQLRLWASGQEAAYLARLGLSAEDVQIQAANPTSAGSMLIRNRAKRQVAKRVEPYFRAADLEFLRKAAALLGGYPETGYSISYHQIPDSPEDEKTDLEAKEVKRRMGLVSTVQLYMQQNPGASREQAIAALKQIQADEAALEAAEPPDTSDAGKPADDTPDPTEPPQGSTP